MFLLAAIFFIKVSFTFLEFWTRRCLFILQAIIRLCALMLFLKLLTVDLLTAFLYSVFAWLLDYLAVNYRDTVIVEELPLWVNWDTLFYLTMLCFLFSKQHLLVLFTTALLALTGIYLDY